MRELSEEANLSPLPPVLLGQVLVIPQGLLNRLAGDLEDPRLVTGLGKPNELR